MLNGVIPASWSGPLHAALRVMTGLLILQHALTKLLHWPATDYFPADQALPALMLVAAIIELVGSVLLIVGFKTRLVAFIVAGHMAFAYFLGHTSMGFFPIQNFGEPAILFCFISLYLAAAGAGPFSLDDSRK